MKKALLTAAAVLFVPAMAQAQSMWAPGPANPGFYIGAEGGGNWLLNSNNYNMDIGYAVGGVMGYDFVGPRLELEGDPASRGKLPELPPDPDAAAFHASIPAYLAGPSRSK